ncbi:hypothetical protein MZK49_13145 [Ensifer sesbaniae]|uniref:hypothetical protein n=1 Tax=Ensifer sesbaniae TaxID=1214071 RepID=UPI002000D2BC|nr:hypothetical protein [Ensifer sesbaniae]
MHFESLLGLLFDDSGWRCDRLWLTEYRRVVFFREIGYRLDPGLFNRLRRRNRLHSRLLHSAGRIIAVEGAKKFVLEIEGGILTDRLLMSLQLLQLLYGRPGIVTDDPGEFGQRIIVCQYVEFSRPASCELFVCHALHSQLPVFMCQCIVGKW